MVEISRKFDSIRFDSIRLALYFVFAYCFSAGLQAMRKMQKTTPAAKALLPNATLPA